MPPRPTTHILPLLALGALLLAGCSTLPWRSGKILDGARAKVAILETTDIHANVLSYDYYRLKPDPTVGFERTATLIRRAREEFPNNFLFDAGDTIQGSVLADYQALGKPVACEQELAVYQAMDAVRYDGGTLGNHDFNYGLGLLSQVTGTPMNVDGVHDRRCAGPHYPLVLANVSSARDGKPIFKPWTIVTRRIRAWTSDGSEITVPLRVGLIGFTPPPIMQWDQHNLAGKVTVSGVVEAAQKYLPELEAHHPDLIVAILHGGLDSHPYDEDMENAGWYLAGVPGIDVLLLGHSHTEFPGPRYAGMEDVDARLGFVRNVPAVMGGFFGKDLGVIELVLHRKDGRWVVDPDHTRSEVRPICPGKDRCVPPDPAIAPLVEAAHRATIAYVNTPIGFSTVHLSSYFADQGNMTALAPVNAAQIAYVRHELPRSHPELADVPVLSAAAAFRTGFGGADDYTDVAPGPLTLRSAADLYYYPNTLAAVKTDGAGLKAWLEKSAQRFNRIDPARTGEQALLNSHHAGYNFDQLQGGIRYVIDVSRPVGQRITSLTYQGKPVAPTDPFIIVTNNYRASGGGHFPGLDGSNVVLAAPDNTREILARWIERRQQIGVDDLEPTSWTFAPLKTDGAVVFTGRAGKLGVAKAAGLTNIRVVRDNGDGTAVYAVDLSH